MWYFGNDSRVRNEPTHLIPPLSRSERFLRKITPTIQRVFNSVTDFFRNLSFRSNPEESIEDYVFYASMDGSMDQTRMDSLSFINLSTENKKIE